jgi:hypothetical protein
MLRFRDLLPLALQGLFRRSLVYIWFIPALRKALSHGIPSVAQTIALKVIYGFF